VEIRLNQDWERAQKRLEAFWERQILDRPCIPVYVEPGSTAPDVPDLERYYTDAETYFAIEQQHYLRRGFLGEAFPVLYTSWRVLPTLLGARHEYQGGTIWYRPVAGSLDEVDLSSFSLEHPVVRAMETFLEGCARLGKGECFIGYPPLANPDEPAILCGFSQYCMDLADDPGKALRLESRITEIWKQLFDRFTDAVNRHMPGSCSWLPAWHPGRAALIEFDLGGMIGSGHFKRFLPYLLARAEHADRAIYHLDGPGALVHLDTILGLAQIDAVQWEPGAGGGDLSDWIPVMRRIQNAGKGLYAGGSGVSVGEARFLLHELEPEGLILPVKVASRNEGERFLEEVGKGIHGRL
jgi:hypothetical protein